MTAFDFFSKASDAAQRAASSMWDKVQGLRGPAQTGTPAPEAVPYQTGAAAEAKWGANGSPEAQAYRTGGTPAAAPEPAAPGGLRGAANRLGRMAGPVGAAVGEAPALMNNIGEEGPMRAIGRSALRGGATMLGGAGGAALGSLAGPVGTAAGGVAGGVAGYKAGDAAADAVFGPEPTRKPIAAAAASTPATNGSTMDGRSSPEGDFLNGRRLPTDTAPGSGLRTVPVSAGDVMSGSANPAPGYGAFQRTTQGNRGQPVAVGGAESLAQNAAQEAANNSLRRPASTGLAPTQPGVFGEIAKGQSLRAADVSAQRQDAQANKNVEHGLTNQSQAITDSNNKASLAFQQKQLTHTVENENEKRVSERSADYVRSKMTPQSAQLYNDPATRAAEEQKLKTQTADLNDRLKHTQSLTGNSVGQLTDQQHTLMLKANDFRERLEGKGREGVIPWAQDFLGDKRFDSKNLYSYLPARTAQGAVKPALPETFGYSVEMGNGNKVKVYKLANGGFNFTGPNDPVDSDAMELIKPAIDASKKAGK